MWSAEPAGCRLPPRARRGNDSAPFTVTPGTYGPRGARVLARTVDRALRPRRSDTRDSRFSAETRVRAAAACGRPGETTVFYLSTVDQPALAVFMARTLDAQHIHGRTQADARGTPHLYRALALAHTHINRSRSLAKDIARGRRRSCAQNTNSTRSTRLNRSSTCCRGASRCRRPY